jgi:hypothetical protein
MGHRRSARLLRCDALHLRDRPDDVQDRRTQGSTPVVTRYPDKVITYNQDRIVDHVRPIRVDHYPSTAKLWEVPTERLSWLVSQGAFHHGLPRMLNCIVPRALFDRFKTRFGNVFASIAPDFNFCFRCLDLEDTILFLDKSPMFHYALNRSNGASVSRGEMTADNADFTQTCPSTIRPEITQRRSRSSTRPSTPSSTST